MTFTPDLTFPQPSQKAPWNFFLIDGKIERLLVFGTKDEIF